jgi:hypothetical protein
MKFELNITMKCNLACYNCNRLCHIYRDRTEHMEVEQIERFVQQIRCSGVPVEKVKVVGGEPLLHPHFVKIYEILFNALNEGLITKLLKIDTNKTIPRPVGIKTSKQVRWMGTEIKKKHHQPALWSPQDLGFVTKGPCDMPFSCGLSLDAYGYLPCSPAIMLTRLLGLDLYRKEYPAGIWGTDKICKHCIFSMDEGWRKLHDKPLKDITAEEKAPTKTWAEGLRLFDTEKFYQMHEKF